MILLIGCLLSLLGGSFGTLSADQYIDYALKVSLPKYIKNEKLDPIDLPNYSYEYSDKTFFGRVNGKADYTNGYASGLSKVDRDSSCHGPFNFTTYTSISCTLRLSELYTRYDGKVKYGKLPKVSITAKAEVEPTLLDIEVVTYTSRRNRPEISTLDVRFFGTLNTHFTGLGPLNKYMKLLEKNYQHEVSYKLYDIIAHKFRHALELALSEADMPQQ